MSLCRQFPDVVDCGEGPGEEKHWVVAGFTMGREFGELVSGHFLDGAGVGEGVEDGEGGRGEDSWGWRGGEGYRGFGVQDYDAGLVVDEGV